MANTTAAYRASPLRQRSRQGSRAFVALSGALLLWSASSSAYAQDAEHWRCEGQLYGVPAVIDGMRLYSTYNAMGDAQVQFQGQVAAQGIVGEMQYAGYTRTAPFQGVMSRALGTVQIGVLDNTGGRMIIYNGRATLGPPQTIGEFVCMSG